MMVTRIQLKDGHAVSEMMPSDEPRRFELCQHSIHRRKTNVFAKIDQFAIDILSRKVSIAAAFENIQNLDSRQCDFQAGFA
jgi:hypothetical protein